jgi:hypothetical protein
LLYRHFLSCNINGYLNKKILLIKDALWLMNNLLAH